MNHFFITVLLGVAAISGPFASYGQSKVQPTVQSDQSLNKACFTQVGDIFDQSKCARNEQLDYKTVLSKVMCPREKDEFETTKDFKSRQLKCTKEFSSNEYYLYLDDLQVNYDADKTQLVFLLVSARQPFSLSQAADHWIGHHEPWPDSVYEGPNAEGRVQEVTQRVSNYIGIDMFGLPPMRWFYQTKASADVAREAKKHKYSAWVKVKLITNSDGQLYDFRLDIREGTLWNPVRKVERIANLRVTAVEYKVFRSSDGKVLASRKAPFGGK